MKGEIVSKSVAICSFVGLGGILFALGMVLPNEKESTSRNLMVAGAVFGFFSLAVCFLRYCCNPEEENNDENNNSRRRGEAIVDVEMVDLEKGRANSGSISIEASLFSTKTESEPAAAAVSSNP